MAKVIIDNFDIPKSCNDCYFSQHLSIDYDDEKTKDVIIRCGLSKERIANLLSFERVEKFKDYINNNKSANCPIKELKE